MHHPLYTSITYLFIKRLQKSEHLWKNICLSIPDIHSLLNIFLSIGIRMNSTADEKKNEDTHEIGGTEENEINNLKLYVLGSIIILTLLGNFLILFLVCSNILLLSKFRSDYLLQTGYLNLFVTCFHEFRIYEFFSQKSFCFLLKVLQSVHSRGVQWGIIWIKFGPRT